MTTWHISAPPLHALRNALALWLQPEQVHPAVANQIAHHSVLRHHGVDGVAWGLHEHAQAQRGVAQRLPVVQRLHGQANAQVATVALNYSDIQVPQLLGQFFRLVQQGDIMLVLQWLVSWWL